MADLKQPTAGLPDMQSMYASVANQLPQVMQDSFQSMNDTKAQMSAMQDYIRNQQSSQLNIPALQFAAGLLKPTRTGSFGESVGAAGEGALGALQKQREIDLDRQTKLMELQQGKNSLLSQQAQMLMPFYKMQLGAQAMALTPSGGGGASGGNGKADALSPSELMAGYNARLAKAVQAGDQTAVTAITKEMELDPALQGVQARSKAFGTGAGERDAGVKTINLSRGETTLPPLPSTQHIVSAPAVAPAAVPNAVPAPKKPDPLALIPPAIPLKQPTSIGEASQVKELAEGLGKRSDEIDKSASDAQNSNMLLDQMAQESQGWRMGKFAAHQQEINSWLDAAKEAITGQKSDPNDHVSDYQAFNKNAGQLTRVAVRQTSPRAAVQEFQMIQNQLPSADMTRGGFDQIRAQLQGVSDFALAQQQAKDMWMKKNNNNLNGFDAWFTNNVNPASFVLHRLDPEEAKTVIEKMKETADGQQALSKLATQNRTAMQLGFFGQ